MVLCSDEEIASINEQWRGKSQPTDVLSFSLGAPLPGSPIRLLGDLYISVPTAERQAAERRQVSSSVLAGLKHMQGCETSH